MNEPWFVYIIRCKDGKLYTGIAKDVQKRVGLHNRGLACRFTKYRNPVELLFTEKHDAEGLARKREHEIKGFSKDKKVALIKDSSTLKGSQNQFFV